MSNDPSLGSIVIAAAVDSFRSNKDLADRAIAQVANAQLHESLDSNTNSIVVIMKHISGNLRSRWTDFLTSDGEKPWRDRDTEFVDTFKSRDELIEFWDGGWQCVFDSLDRLGEEDLLKTVSIRGKPHTVPMAINRSLAHCGYHVGQIVMIARFHAKANWETLTIAPGKSQDYNRGTWGQN